jgi:hypothetical protein
VAVAFVFSSGILDRWFGQDSLHDVFNGFVVVDLNTESREVVDRLAVFVALFGFDARAAEGPVVF